MHRDPDLKQQLARLNEIGIALSSERDYDKLLRAILREAREFTRAEAGTLYVIEGEAMLIVAAQNERLQQGEGQRCPVILGPHNRLPLTPHSMAGYVGITGQIVNLENVYQIPLGRPYSFDAEHDRRNNYRSRSMLVVPMTEPDGTILGVLQLINARDSAGQIASFTPEWEPLVRSLASQAAVTIRNVRLTQQLKGAYSDTIFRLSVVAEYKDEDTAMHIHRMAHYSGLIAQAMGFDRDRVETLLYAAPMHDVGKVGIREGILRKPGKLTPDEYEEMKQHTVLGARIFEGSNVPILKMSAAIALTHHERFDGSGYPQGLIGDAIPIEGQIVGLADVFDALSSKRCYKPAYPIEKCLEILEEQRGRHFQSDLLDAFLAHLDDVLIMRDHYSSISDVADARHRQLSDITN
jgi:putative two-component system response regulator